MSPNQQGPIFFLGIIQSIKKGMQVFTHGCDSNFNNYKYFFAFIYISFIVNEISLK